MFDFISAVRRKLPVASTRPHNETDSTRLSETPPPTPEMTNTFPRFWMVKCGCKTACHHKPPSVEHKRFQDAYDESKRLTNKEGVEFVILEAVAKAIPSLTPKQRACSEYFQHRGGVSSEVTNAFTAGWSAHKKHINSFKTQ